jgi:hypothetical protein
VTDFTNSKTLFFHFMKAKYRYTMNLLFSKIYSSKMVVGWGISQNLCMARLGWDGGFLKTYPDEMG